MKKMFYMVAGAAAFMVVQATAADVASLEAAFAKVRAVADGVCAVTDVSLRLKADPEGKEPLNIKGNMRYEQT